MRTMERAEILTVIKDNLLQNLALIRKKIKYNEIKLKLL